MATCLHVCVRRKLSPDRFTDGVQLTPREYEYLERAVQRKFLGTSAASWASSDGRTAAFHLENATKKLGVRTMQGVARFSASRKVLS
ncbi:hypothetical protein RFM41_32460 [Mesorhizobium sp. VK25A]|uniref:HTH luxR-type domain-containing protein n=1 Tax=Mesorhizobium vachelliae TaxID=3072309 RepID=A0ABU5AEN6_9HYPH|nr:MULTISPECIES: hypothetical protein [unclassified Mesorhizobium]MDX8535748.1 hypothetical protein [Mesorhizobium sp. VK25D]MDX8548471.1 hypothetical protein [Mesorhizobium sp. VK25A]